jgi:hypothetical protein
MQYHFMVMFDDETNKWSVDPSLYEYLTDGTIYNPNLIENGFPNDIYPGWFFPEEGSREEELDFELFRTLQSVVDTFPVPQEA